ncbi:MAG: class F sortase [Thermomicrobiales bacterium]|nr:class F sortase [Thermomicrobiales bacterium]
MKQGSRTARAYRIIGILVALALLLGMLLPLAGVAAQDASDQGTSQEVLAEVPTTGGRRPGPVVLGATTARRAAPTRPAGFVPVELQVDSIGLDAPIEQGSIVDGVMLDPSGPWVVTWYSQLGKVGQGGNVVMAGHVDYWDTGPAIFWSVPNLQPGDILRIIGADGETIEYAIEWTQLFHVASELTPDVIQNQIVGDSGQESLTLITCGGEFDAAAGEYLYRWVLRANKI